MSTIVKKKALKTNPEVQPSVRLNLYKKPPRQRVRAKVTSKGQITLPQYLRHELGLKFGDEVEFEFVEGHGWRIRRYFDPEKFEKALRKLRGTINPAFKGMTTDEIIEEMRGPVDLD